MTEHRDTPYAKNVCRSSEFIKTAADFAKYANTEWIKDNTSERAMLMCCIDSTLPSGTGVLHMVSGGRGLLVHAVSEIMREDDFKQLFHEARIISEDADAMIRDVQALRRKVYKAYMSMAVIAVWTLCIVGFQAWGVAEWITTISSLMLMSITSVLVLSEIKRWRRRLKHAEMNLQEKKEQEKAQEAQKVMEALDEILKRSSEDDDDDDK